ncbi:MAG: class I SAM-dependent methyltransferase [Spirochaetia bacterium]|nr:class I SAM-dependent methyltransferase [Spirochaetia bacterium]
MSNENNRNKWNLHYERDKAKQHIPDENIVRFFQHYLRKNPDLINPCILEMGSGSGRNLTYLQLYSNQVYGMDFARKSLESQQGVVCAVSHEAPFGDHLFDIVIAWGLLHYLSDKSLDRTIDEVRRLLKPDGIFFGTLRSSKDTHLAQVLKSGDLMDGEATFYDKSEVNRILKDFKKVKLGFILRQSPGDEGIIAHHIFEATI